MHYAFITRIFNSFLHKNYAALCIFSSKYFRIEAMGAEREVLDCGVSESTFLIYILERKQLVSFLKFFVFNIARSERKVSPSFKEFYTFASTIIGET